MQYGMYLHKIANVSTVHDLY